MNWLKLLRFSAYLVYLLLATCLILTGIEITLWGMDCYSPGRFPLLAVDDYPSHPEQYVKIAVFGESSAKGQGAERSAVDIMKYELQRQFPDRKFFFRNYARPGTFFHGYQAKMAMANISRYDVIVLYAGHNEVHTILDANGYFRKPEYKSIRQVVRLPGDDFDWYTRYLDYHSRIYAYVVRRKAESFSKKIASAGGIHKPVIFQPFVPEEQGAVPPGDRERLVKNYAKDMKEIAELAHRYNKQVVAMVPVSNREWIPCFSLRAASLAPGKSMQWQSLYQRGVDAFSAGRYAEAIHPLRAALAIDPGVAITNYMLGLSLKRLGKTEEGRTLLSVASDTDGYTTRALGAFTPAVAEAARAWPENFHFIDGMANFEKLVDRGYVWNDLFVDIHHPSFAGYVVVGRLFADLIAALPLLNKDSNRLRTFDADIVNLTDLTRFYKQELKVTTVDTASVALERAGWFIHFADLSGDPDFTLIQAERYLDRFREIAVPEDPEAAEIYDSGMRVLAEKRKAHEFQ